MQGPPPAKPRRHRPSFSCVARIQSHEATVSTFSKCKDAQLMSLVSPGTLSASLVRSLRPVGESRGRFLLPVCFLSPPPTPPFYDPKPSNTDLLTYMLKSTPSTNTNTNKVSSSKSISSPKNFISTNTPCSNPIPKLTISSEDNTAGDFILETSKIGGLRYEPVSSYDYDPNLLSPQWTPRPEHLPRPIDIDVITKRKLQPFSSPSRTSPDDPQVRPIHVQTYQQNDLEVFQDAVERVLGFRVVFFGEIDFPNDQTVYVPIYQEAYYQQWLVKQLRENPEKIRIDAWRAGR